MDQAGLRNCELLIAECGLKRNPLKSEIGGPMLFAQKLLAPGPQPPAEPGVYHNENNLDMIKVGRKELGP